VPCSGRGVFGASWQPAHLTTTCTRGAVWPHAQVVTVIEYSYMSLVLWGYIGFDCHSLDRFGYGPSYSGM